MVGITSIGVYVPVYRISRDEIGRMWGTRSPGGEKAVAGHDEDSITMAVAGGARRHEEQSGEDRRLVCRDDDGAV